VIRLCEKSEFERIYAIINKAAVAYKGVIPEQCWTEPYMSRSELQDQIDEGVVFWGYEENGQLVGIMGIQRVRDVTLIRHAYILRGSQRQGIGERLLLHLRGLARTPVLIGTWVDAVWAIKFYEKNGFERVPAQEKDRLVQRYWAVPDRQRKASVVLADRAWHERNGELERRCRPRSS
jgi:GNAT superfamily N-acetyltransferase